VIALTPLKFVILSEMAAPFSVGPPGGPRGQEAKNPSSILPNDHF